MSVGFLVLGFASSAMALNGEITIHVDQPMHTMPEDFMRMGVR